MNIRSTPDPKSNRSQKLINRKLNFRNGRRTDDIKASEFKPGQISEMRQKKS